VSKRFVTHDTMVIERTYQASPERVFAAWADPAAKTVWMLGAEEEFDPQAYRLDFRVGGGEWLHGEHGGEVYTYDARYDDIVENERIVFSYYMLRDDVRLSASVTSIEFRPSGDATQLVLTEHGIYLDGEDKPELRLAGVTAQLDALTGWLEKNGAAR
jgi:uncharacterized protein YndB with AHSA1/START domain